MDVSAWHAGSFGARPQTSTRSPFQPLIPIHPPTVRREPVPPITIIDDAARGDAHVGRHPVVAGNNVQLLVDSPQMAPRLFEDVRNARTVVDVSMFSWFPNGTGEQLANLLISKAKAGVEVNVQVDTEGSVQIPGTSFYRMFQRMQDAGVNIRRNPWVRVDRSGVRMLPVDHRKLAVIDGNIAYLGGMNLSAGYDDWHDTMLRIQGPAAAVAGAEFVGRWSDLGGNLSRPHELALEANLDRPAPDGNIGVKIIANTPGGDEAITDEFFNLAKTAQKRLWIETPFVGSPAMVQALAGAVQRGVDVRVAVPGFFTWKAGIPTAAVTRSFFADMLTAGVKLYEQPQMTHAKMILADDLATVGSFNLTERSSHDIYEIAAQISDAGFTNQLSGLFTRDFERSRVVDPAEARSLDNRFVAWVRRHTGAHF